MAGRSVGVVTALHATRHRHHNIVHISSLELGEGNLGEPANGGKDRQCTKLKTDAVVKINAIRNLSP